MIKVRKVIKETKVILEMVLLLLDLMMITL